MSFISLMDKSPKKPLNILILSCNNINLLSDIKSKYKNSKIYIITNENIDDSLYNDINIIVGNIEAITLDFKKKFFDYIILDHALENLIDPWNTFPKISKYLKESGDLICSFTNVMHISILKDLLNGNFSYINSQFFNKDTIRFFTLKEIKKLLLENNFNDPYVINYYTIAQDEDLIEKLLSINDSSSKLDYSTYEYFIKSQKQFDPSKYDSIDMTNLKYKLMRIDNKLDIENSISYISNFQYEDLEEFTEDILYLINHFTINKNFVLSTLKSSIRK
ncbi:hypothetical protein CM240_1088 [Clostridium bornimense]|uniref:Methyltransferase type 11 domain-containing protein n=1 Tax=Clostridium bornimense TaxID=1216932 RepID=W6S1T1_9CLOT|nr:methyltransferase domain-containing protein [Clostridium bornimense]CDM68252.1 hypothetical protein CM240_1088 [Clostridium bornimense]